MTPRGKSPEQLFDLRQDQIEKIKNKRNFPERSLDKFMPNLANLANKNRLHTGWETSRDKGSEIKAPAHYIMMNSGLKDTLQYSDMKMLSPDVIVDSKHGHSPKGSSLTHKLR